MSKMIIDNMKQEKSKITTVAMRMDDVHEFMRKSAL